MTVKPGYEDLEKKVQQLEKAEFRRRKAEGMLVDSKKRLLNIIEDIPALILRFDPEGIVSFVNKESCLFFSKGEQELLGIHFLELVPEEEKESIWERFLALTPTNPANTHEYQIVSGDGFPSWYHWMNRAVFSEQGAVSVYQTVGYDVTEKKQIDKEMREKEKLQGVIELAGTVCHELSQPMQIISGVSDLLLMNLPEDDSLHNKLGKIKEQIERMAGLTMKLRDITRYETKIYNGETKIIDLDQSTERRNATRYIPINPTTVALKFTHPLIETQLIDIGRIGLSFWCDIDKVPKDTVFKIDIHTRKGEIALKDIPCIYISGPDSAGESPLQPGRRGRCSVKFFEPGADQMNDIQFFVERHTKA